jgi:hypothetical protein
MSGHRRIPPVLRELLDETGLPWELERGSRHWHVRLAGRRISVVPTTLKLDRGGRCFENMAAQIRRSARELKT